MIIKLVYNKEIHLFKLENPVLDQIKNHILKLHPQINQNYSLIYKDEDGDMISITSDEDLKVLIENVKNQTVKITIQTLNTWACKYCTFENSDGIVCEACSQYKEAEPQQQQFAQQYQGYQPAIYPPQCYPGPQQFGPSPQQFGPSPQQFGPPPPQQFGPLPPQQFGPPPPQPFGATPPQQFGPPPQQPPPPSHVPQYPFNPHQMPPHMGHFGMGGFGHPPHMFGGFHHFKHHRHHHMKWHKLRQIMKDPQYKQQREKLQQLLKEVSQTLKNTMQNNSQQQQFYQQQQWFWNEQDEQRAKRLAEVLQCDQEQAREYLQIFRDLTLDEIVMMVENEE